MDSSAMNAPWSRPCLPGLSPGGVDPDLTLSSQLFHSGPTWPPDTSLFKWSMENHRGPDLRPQFIWGWGVVLEGSQTSGNSSEPGKFQGGTSKTNLWIEATVSGQRPILSSGPRCPSARLSGSTELGLGGLLLSPSPLQGGLWGESHDSSAHFLSLPVDPLRGEGERGPSEGPGQLPPLELP